MKVLVTGASGRIGANIVHELASAGHSVRAGIRPGTTRRSKLEALGVEIVESDLLDRESLAMSVVGTDVVVHNGVVFTGEPARMVSGALECTTALLEAARLNGCARFVFISSTAVYEGGAYRPGDPVREAEATTEITNVYGACKLASEALCSAYMQQHGLPTVSLRFPMVAAGAELLSYGFLLETWREGPARFGDLAWRERIEEAWQDGARVVVPLNSDGTPWKRHFCDVRDAARSVRLALESPEAPGRAYNIASKPIGYNEAADVLAHVARLRSASVPFPDGYRYEFALSRAHEFLGYDPEFGVERMIEDAWRTREGGPVPGLILP